MTSIVGKGPLKTYSQTLTLTGPAPVADLPELMKVPEEYRENIIAVRGGKVLSLDELVNDGDEILVFLSVMGG